LLFFSRLYLTGSATKQKNMALKNQSFPAFTANCHYKLCANLLGKKPPHGQVGQDIRGQANINFNQVSSLI
jgi:hypothetical protein